MEDIGNSYLLEGSDVDEILLEDGLGVLELESGPDYTGLGGGGGEIKFNNYLFVTVGNGMSTSEKIR